MDWPAAGVLITAILGFAAAIVARFLAQRPSDSNVSDTVVKALVQNVNSVQVEVALLKQADRHIADKLESFTNEWRQYTRDRERLNGEMTAQLGNMSLQIAKLSTEVHGITKAGRGEG